MTTRHVVLVGLLAGAVSLGTSGTFAQQGTGSTGPVSLRVASARQAIAMGRSRQAVQMLKELVASHPDDPWLVQELALAYQADHNDFWALNVLRSFRRAHPPACDVVASMTRIYIDQANLELADQQLQSPGCPDTEVQRARFALLRYEIAKLRGDEQGQRRWFDTAARSRYMFEEDLKVFRALAAQREPGRLPWVSGRIDLAAGHTTDGLAGSPQDPSVTGDDTASALTQVVARVRLVAPVSGPVRPVLEAQVRGVGLWARAVEGLSYWQPSLRPGLLLGRTFPRLLLSYDSDAVQIAASDRYDSGPLWYAQSHRFDYELEANGNLMAFGGGGKRWYREQGRTRWEFEQGMAGGLALSSRLRLLVGGSVRWYDAQNIAYDAVGGSTLAQGTYDLPWWSTQARLNVTGSFDYYPRSQGYFAGARGDKRLDGLVMVKLGMFSGDWSGMRLGADVAYAHRESSAVDYSYTDLRTLLHVQWSGSLGRVRRQAIEKNHRAIMRYRALPGAGDAPDSGTDVSRIRELMRQDESVKRGSSCLN